MKNNLSLNRIIYPDISLEAFFELADKLGFKGVELRNDINDGQIFDNIKPEKVKVLAEKHGLQIISINAIQKFNLGSKLMDVLTEVKELIELAKRSGCRNIVLCPNNELDDNRQPEQRYKETVASLKAIGPLVSNTELTFLVEPLGFEECSLRSKKEAIKAIQDSGYPQCYKLVHDTFHHYLGTDEEIYPEFTGLVHISGVEASLPKNKIRDEHRILISKNDIMDNTGQIAAFKKAGFKGYFSFEPFSEAVQKMNFARLIEELENSLKYVFQ
jgi:2-keto-myo-inositol isomerase